MLVTDLRTTISEAPLRSLDTLSRDVWKAHTANLITDDEAQGLAEAIHRRRQNHRTGPSQPTLENAPVSVTEGSGRPSSKPERVWSYFPRKRPQRSPDRARSIERRRTLAASSPLPPKLAAHFTVSEQSVCRIVADEVRDKGVCALSVAEIASRAGTCATKVRMALKIAASLGLIVVTERRVPYRPNLPNLVRIVSTEWLLWAGRWKAKEPTPNHPTTKAPVRTRRLLTDDRVQKKEVHGNQVVIERKRQV